MTVTMKQVKEALGYSVDMVSKNRDGEFVIRLGYFYRNGMDSGKFATNTMKILRSKGLDVILVGCGDVWKPFRGSAKLQNQSHFYATFKAA